MIRTHSQKQLTLAEYDWPFQTEWDAFYEGQYLPSPEWVS